MDKESILEELEGRIKHFTNQLTNEKVELSKNLEKKDKEIERLLQDGSNVTAYKDMYDKSMKNNTKLEKKVQQLNQELDDEMAKKNDYHSNNLKLLEGLRGLEKTKQAFDSERDNLVKEFSDEQRQLKYYATEIKELQKEKEKINKDNIKMADEIVRLSQMLKSLGDNYSEAKDQLRRFKNRCSTDSKENNSPKLRESYLIKDYEERITSLQEDNVTLKDENEKLADYVRQLEKHIHEKDIEIEDYEKTMNDTSSKEIDYKNKLEQEFSVNDKLLKKYEFISQEYDKITEEHNRIIDDQEGKDKLIAN